MSYENCGIGKIQGLKTGTIVLETSTYFGFMHSEMTITKELSDSYLPYAL